MQLSRKLLAHAQRGDTIIEVMVAMTVAASVLGITYSVMNKNLLISRANQERTEASKIVQGQLEALRSLSSTAGGLALLVAENPPAVGATGAFCLDPSAALIHRQAAITGPDASGAVSFSVDASCMTGPDNRYKYIIANDSSVADHKLYRIIIIWDSVNGGQDMIAMSYRI